MASITYKKGRATIQFIAADRKRRSVRVGLVSRQQAHEIRRRIEHLNAVNILGQMIDEDAARWLMQLDDWLYDRLAAAGLAPERTNKLSLAPFLSAYAKTHSEGKAGGTVANWEQTSRDLIQFFTPDKALRKIAASDAKRWASWLKNARGLGPNTVARSAGIARQFFSAAREQKLIASNPFDAISSSVKPKKDRQVFVERETTRQLLDACPSLEWRVIFSLARFGGLRCPSELRNLTWGDVDWHAGRMRIPSPKTGERIAPLFPEVRQELDAAYHAAPDGAVLILPMLPADSTLRSQAKQIVRQAKLKSWPKVFQNLRASRETELEKEFPVHVVCRWLGNSPKIATESYLMTTDEHWQKATG